jgi:hypothetical protein
MITCLGYEVSFVEFDSKHYRLINPAGEIIVELTSHEYLTNPQLRNIRLTHGKHRRPSAAFRGNPARQPNHPRLTGATWRTFAYETRTGSIEDAGIRAGEVIAYRCWRVHPGNRLFSTYMIEFEWHPGHPATGVVRDGDGVYAFKELGLATKYISEMCPCVHFINRDLTIEVIEASLAIGTVALWGEIVEHERGYRAEFAKIVGIDRVTSDDPRQLYRLRKRYGLPKGPMFLWSQPQDPTKWDPDPQSP